MRERTPPQRKGRRTTQQRPRTRQTTTPRKRVVTRRVRRSIRAAGPNATVRKRGNVFYLYQRERRSIPVRLIFALLIVFVGGIGSAVIYANIHDMQREIRIAQAALQAQLETNLTMDAVTTERYTHDEIVRRARALGLGEPDPSQIIYFYPAPLHSGVFFTYNPTPPQENHFWQGIVTFLRSITERITG